jgi:putative membrane protein insertion efficiency factor
MISLLRTVLAGVLIVALRLYRGIVSPLLVAFFGARCRFYPSCSAYAEECIRRYGPLGGAWRAVRRLARCHPLHPGGFDPVGEPEGKPSLHG